MRSRGFTLIELLVVVAIIAMLISIMIPVMGRARESGRTVVCLSNMRQMALGMIMYADDNRNTLPSVGLSHGSHQVDEQGSWLRLLEPYCKTELVYRCPSDHSRWWDTPLPDGDGTRMRKISFATNYYISGMYEEEDTGETLKFNRMTQIDRPGKTIFAAELADGDDPSLGQRYWEYAAADHVHPSIHWLLDDKNVRKQVAIDRHAVGANYVFLDGHAETLSFEKTFQLDPNSVLDPANPGAIRWRANLYDPRIAQ